MKLISSKARSAAKRTLGDGVGLMTALIGFVSIFLSQETFERGLTLACGVFFAVVGLIEWSLAVDPLRKISLTENAKRAPPRGESPERGERLEDDLR